MNLCSPNIVYTSVPMCKNYTRLKEGNIIEPTAEHRWIAIVVDFVLVHAVDAYDIISSLQSQAASSEPDSRPSQATSSEPDSAP